MKFIALDAYGGDNAPQINVDGALQAVEAYSDITVLLVGKQDELSKLLEGKQYDKSRLEIVPASEVITTHEQPTVALREKKDSSLVVGLNLVKTGRAQAFVSAGSTGAVLAGGLFIVGRIKGIERPALATMLPNEKGAYTLLLDSGANVDCKPPYLAQFGLMGSLYMEHVQGIKNPRVGLVNIGTEAEKGNALVKEAYPLLEAVPNINFIGNVEPRDIPAGDVDVAVCDGFVGNVILKLSEGFVKSLLNMIKRELMSTFMSKMGALLSKGAFKNLKKGFDYTEVGGAAFIGLNGLVVKAHGSSNAKAIKNAIRQCSVFIDSDIVGKIAANIKKGE